jgi:SAM-dependent methyltransferase
MKKQCKICGSTAKETFHIPSSKYTGKEIPNEPDDCIYYQCVKCNFCFTDILDNIDHTQVYDKNYWEGQDPDWSGRVNQSLRLVMLANSLLNKDPSNLDILDFGCGMGTFIEAGRKQLQMNIWGHDIIEPKFGTDYFLKELPKNKFDVIISCEVIEHLPFPVEIITDIIQSLKPGGVFAFQTALYDPKGEKRNWWYVGPANGHISFYSKEAFDYLFTKLSGVKRANWNGYNGIQAWQLKNTANKNNVYKVILPQELSFIETDILYNGAIKYDRNKFSSIDTIFYGPYIVMEKGEYEILIEGKLDGDFLVSLTQSCGKKINSHYRNIQINNKNKKFKLKLENDIENFEILLKTTNNSISAEITFIYINKILN